MSDRLPPDPTPGMIVETEPGVYFQYDAVLHTWVKLSATRLSSPLATSLQNGTMAAVDLAKLNRLVIPPMATTLGSDQCDTVFGTGALALRSMDNLMRVSGTRDLVTRDESGQQQVTTVPFHIHQHTYGYDFKLDLQQLVDELTRRGQYQVKGNRGPQGPKGRQGPPGEQQLLTGPRGERGPAGSAPPCRLQLEREVYPAKPPEELRQAIVGLRLEPGPQSDQYQIVAQRQAVGTPDASAGLLKIGGDHSPWVLALENTVAVSQPVYYLDVEPMVAQIRQRFLEELARLKTSFEGVVRFWLQQMSELYDQQRLALCCALEFCQSRNSHTLSRRHMEQVLGSAVGRASVTIHDRSADSALELPVAPECEPQNFPDQEVSQQSLQATITLPVERLRWYEQAWQQGRANGLVVELQGQDFIILSRPLAGNVGPTLAWPSFDGRSFVALPPSGAVELGLQGVLQQLLLQQLHAGRYGQRQGGMPELQQVYFPLGN